MCISFSNMQKLGNWTVRMCANSIFGCNRSNPYSAVNIDDDRDACNLSCCNLLDWWLHRDTSSVVDHLSGGFIMGCNVLCRPTAAVWFVFLIAAWLLKRGDKGRFKFAMLFIIATTATLTPWVIRNLLIFDKPIWATTHGGYTLLLANNPLLYDQIASGNYSREWNEELFHEKWAQRNEGDPREATFWLAPVTEDKSRLTSPQTTLDKPWMGELVDDKLASQSAMKLIRNQPLIFLKSALVRLAWLWAPWPSARQGSAVQRFVIGFWYCTVLAAFFVSFVWNRSLPSTAKNVAAEVSNFDSTSIASSFARQPLAPAILLICAISFVHAVYWSNMRMRAVAMPAVYVVLAYQVSQISGKHRGRHEV